MSALRFGVAVVFFGLAVEAWGGTIAGIQSTFDVNDEGWRVADLTFPAVGAPPPVLGVFVPVYSATGGNPGGHISLNDPSVNVMYWRAPAAYLGDQSAAFGGSLTYSLRYIDGTSTFSQEDVVLVGGGLTLVYDFAGVPTSVWQPFTVPLTETGWRVNALNGAAATAQQMQTALGSLTALYLRAEFRNSLEDTSYLDSVTLTYAVPPPCDGDANGDGVVNFADITNVLANFGASYGAGNTGPGDANHDGVVNFADVTNVLANFGSDCV